MNPRDIYDSYMDNKNAFYTYISDTKRHTALDIYTVINPTLIANPFVSSFPKNFFLNLNKKTNRFMQFVKVSIKFYAKNSYLFVSYLIAFLLFKLFYKKTRHDIPPLLIDIYVLVDRVNKEKAFNEAYFVDIYRILDSCGVDYAILPRLYNIGRNPFKLIKFFDIIMRDSRKFVFEFELLRFVDFIKIFFVMVQYPFRTLKLLCKENSTQNSIFNTSVIDDISSFSLDGLTRYFIGKHIAQTESVSKIFSWSEFQVNERSFNYAIRKNNSKIKITACQFYLNYETYLNTIMYDLDYEQQVSAHTVLVNGSYYILDRKNIIYRNGVSLRYGNVFSFAGTKNGENIVLLGSYLFEETKYMLQGVACFDRVLLKKHREVDINKIGRISDNNCIIDQNIYKLFENAKIVIGTASGSLVEAVACGVPVVVIASFDNLTANPLVEYGKGKIWDIAFSLDQVGELCRKLIGYRVNNKEEIANLSKWYKDSFFVEPTDRNIIEAFELEDMIS